MRFDLAQGGEVQPVGGLYVSGDFFTTLGVQASLGRMFSADDDVPCGGRRGAVAVISYAFWQQRLGGATDVIGKPLVIEHVPFTVVGVTPRAFFGAEVGRGFDVVGTCQRAAADQRCGAAARGYLVSTAGASRPSKIQTLPALSTTTPGRVAKSPRHRRAAGQRHRWCLPTARRQHSRNRCDVMRRGRPEPS